MEFHQIGYFINLAETLNFTVAARRSGVSQPTLTRAIRRLEEDLGGLLIYRDGKNSRLTPLGAEVATEFRRVDLALRNVREHSENFIHGQRRIIEIAVAATIGPLVFMEFFATAMAQMPAVELNIRHINAREAADAVLSGRLHACIIPRTGKDERKLDIRPLFREPFHLGCAETHPLAAQMIIRVEDMASYPFVDRLGCESRSVVRDHFALQKAIMVPRYRAAREDWVQAMLAQGDAICILPTSSKIVPGVITKPIEGFDLERELVFLTVSGSGTPTEVRKLSQMAAKHPWHLS